MRLVLDRMLDGRRLKAIADSPKVDLLGRSIDRCDASDPVLIPERNDYGNPHPPGPSWERVYQEQADGSKKWLKPLIRCKCGSLSGIALHHVHADGRVTASYYDSEADSFEHGGKKYSHIPGCGWHVFIKLDGYDLGEFPPEPG